MENPELLLSISDLSVRFGPRAILEQVSISVHRNEIIGIIGPNGGGKTTLVRCILGLVRPSSGQIVQAEGLSIGYLPQASRLDHQFPISVEEVILSGLLGNAIHQRPSEEERRKVHDIMERLELLELSKKPIGLLSGGQLQRVLLSRALIMNPDLLILDEPGTYLDLKGKERLILLLQEVRKQCAILIVSHDIEALKRLTSHIAFVNRRLVFPYHNEWELGDENS